MPGLEDLTSDLEVTSPQVNVDIDRDKAAALGVTASQIENAFYDAYGPRWVSTIYAPVNEYKVLLELAPQFQAGPGGAVDAVLQGDAYARSRTGGSGGALPRRETREPRERRQARRRNRGTVVPLDTLATIKQLVGPQTVNHYGQLPAVTISFGLAPGASLGDVLTQRAGGRRRHAARRASAASSRARPRRSRARSSNLAVLLVIAVMVVYIVLGILYESYIHPLTILSGLPSAAFGALLTLILFRMDLNIYAFVGMIMLIGIVEKNAIMQIDFALEAERGGMTPEQAIYQGLPDPLPADHDDDDGGAAGRGADCDRLRRRRRSAAAARAGGGRRVAVFAAGHAVPDAGRLHLHGAAAGVDEVAPHRAQPATDSR